jgi:RNA-directed DNA polymerase
MGEPRLRAGRGRVGSSMVRPSGAGPERSRDRSNPARTPIRPANRPEPCPVDHCLDHHRVRNIVGGVISPLLANLFMHYAFDVWMQKTHPDVPFERYADDVVVHAKSQAQAEQVLEAIRHRLKECHLELHPEKTRIVYCQDSDRTGQHDQIQFDFLGYCFRPRRAKNRWGKPFVSFLPAISTKAAQAIRETIRTWRLAATRNNQSLEDIARLVNPSVRGWVNYYGRFYRSALTPVLRHLEGALVRWACRKFKRLRRHYTLAAHWLGRVSRRDPNLLVHWQIGIRPATGS